MRHFSNQFHRIAYKSTDKESYVPIIEQSLSWGIEHKIIMYLRTIYEEEFVDRHCKWMETFSTVTLQLFLANK